MAISREEKIQIIQKIKTALSACSHYADFSKRVLPHLEKVFVPSYDVWIYDDKSKGILRYCYIRVKKSRLLNEGEYDPSYVEFPFYIKDNEKWLDKLNETLAREDPSDEIEREGQEKCHYEYFQTLEDHITRLQQKIAELRKEGIARIDSLPEPSCATLRKGGYGWKQPTETLREKFPKLFGRNNED